MWMAIIKQFWPAIPAAILTGMLALFLHNADVDRLEAKQTAALTVQADTLKKRCESDKKITEDVTNDYQTNINALDTQLAALQLHERCVAVEQPSHAAASNHGSASAGKHAQPNGKSGVTASVLYQFAADAEKYRLRLISCQSFISKTWAENK